MSTNTPKFSNSELEQRKSLMDKMQFLGQMSSTVTAMFHQAAAAKYGLGITDIKTISTLRLEGPMTAGQIAKRLSLTSGAITSVIDRLERQHLVKRTLDPKDRRKVIVVLNYEKLNAGKNVYQSMRVGFDKLLKDYSTEELTFLVQFYQSFIELTKSEIAKLNDQREL